MRHLVCAALLLILPSLAGAQEKTVPTPPNVKVEGMPPIPQSIADGLARYAQFRQAQLMAWHPTKRQILITTAFSANPPVPQLHLVDGPGRDRRQLTFYPSGLPVFDNSVAFDPADGNSFVFQYDPAGTELRSLYKYDLTTGDTTLVTASKARYAHVWSRQGKWLAYDSAERNGKDRDLYVIQPADPKTKRRLGDFDGAFGPQDWSPDGNSLVAIEFLSNFETYVWLVDIKTGAKRALTPRDGEKAAWLSARFSADGKRVYALTDRSSGDFRVWRCEIAKCVWTPVTGDGVVIDVGNNSNGLGGFELSSDGSLLAAVVDKGSTTELQVIDLTTLKPRALPAINKGIVSQLNWRPGSRELGFSLGSVRAQGDVYSIDTSLGTLTKWTTSETTFNADALPPPEVVEWKSFDGVTISGILYRPAAKFTGPRPVMLNIHGGPDLHDRARWQGRSNYLLNELGVAIIYPNVRGSSGFGREFSQLDDGKARDGAVKDIGALLDWIAAHPEFDKGRVVLNGVSYGGWLSLEAGIFYNDRIRAVIEGAGITDLVTFLEQTDGPRQENRRREYGDERDPAMREYLKSISPITRVAELKKPTLILQAGKDARVPATQGQELLKALKANNAPVWYLEWTEANHDNLAQLGGDFVLQSWIMFLKTFVLN
jgi:dipeptidyl aminopeptidase/acylaminoacyl peptidase